MKEIKRLKTIFENFRNCVPNKFNVFTLYFKNILFCPFARHKLEANFKKISEIYLMINFINIILVLLLFAKFFFSLYCYNTIITIITIVIITTTTTTTIISTTYSTYSVEDREIEI